MWLFTSIFFCCDLGMLVQFALLLLTAAQGAECCRHNICYKHAYAAYMRMRDNNIIPPPNVDCRFNDNCGSGYVCEVTVRLGQETGKCVQKRQCYHDWHCKFQDPRPGMSKLGTRGPGHICKKSSGECVPPPPSYFANGEAIVSFLAFDTWF